METPFAVLLSYTTSPLAFFTMRPRRPVISATFSGPPSSFTSFEGIQHGRGDTVMDQTITGSGSDTPPYPALRGTQLSQNGTALAQAIRMMVTNAVREMVGSINRYSGCESIHAVC